MEAIILAGGFGTRLKSAIGDDIPKPMADINGRPFLEIYMRYLRQNGVTRFIISLHHLSDVIKKHFGDSFAGVPVTYIEEVEPLGTGGAVKLAIRHCSGNAPVLISNGDSFIEFDLTAMLAIHTSARAVMTIALAEKDDCSRYGEVALDGNRIVSFSYPGRAHNGFISTGLYIAEPDIFADMNLPDKFSLESDFQKPMCSKLYFAAYKAGGCFIDIGMPEDYARARAEATCPTSGLASIVNAGC